MAGGFGHVTDDDTVRLSTPGQIVDMLENGGDVVEAVTEMYGMIVYLARLLGRAYDAVDSERIGMHEPTHREVAATIQEAEARYREVIVPSYDPRFADRDARRAGTWLF